VLALSIATSAFPVLSARDGSGFDRTCAGSTRAVLLFSWLGTAVLAAIAIPASHVLAKQPGQVPELILCFAAFTPGLAAIGVITNLSRVMLALGRLRIAAWAVAGSQVIVVLADVMLVELVPARLVVGALALGNTIGYIAVAVPLVIATRRVRGSPAVQGVGRAAFVGLVAASAGAAAGLAAGFVLPVSHKLEAVGVAVAAAGCAVLVYGVVIYALDNGDLRAVLARLRQRGGLET
jgi:putative peptidoglycan lipid II flippase